MKDQADRAKRYTGSCAADGDALLLCIALAHPPPVAMHLQGCAHRRGDPGTADGLAEQEDNELGGVSLPGAG